MCTCAQAAQATEHILQGLPLWVEHWPSATHTKLFGSPDEISNTAAYIQNNWTSCVDVLLNNSKQENLIVTCLDFYSFNLGAFF